MRYEQSPERSFISGRNVRPFVFDAAQSEAVMNQLHMLGIGISMSDVRSMYNTMQKAGAFAADDLQGTMFPGTIGIPIQFLQNWLPGVVRTITQARTIDLLTGISSIGSWEDDEVIQTVLEPTGKAVLYGDYTNIPLSSWNPTFERRTVVRIEMGLRVGALEEARSARMNVNTATEKRYSTSEALEILRNRIGFYGFNGGLNRTYGFLNDPSLPAYVTAATGVGGGTSWAGKTFLEITADIRGMLARLRAQTKGAIDPRRDPITLAVANNKVDYLTVTAEFGAVSVEAWLKTTYPNVRVEGAPELDGANGGADVAYAYAETVGGSGTDDGRVWTQIVPTKFQMLGVEKQAKAYVEDYVSATAGVMLKRPYGVTRLTGI